MSTSPAVKDILERNKKLAINHKPFPFLSEVKALGMSTPQTLVLTCVDPRCVPEKFLDLQPAEALVLRNVCGHVAPNMNDILAGDYLFHFQDFMIIHHTDCGALQYKDTQIEETLKDRVPTYKNTGNNSFGAVTDIEQSVKDDLAILKASPLMRKELAEHTYGFVYDIKTGLLSAVDG